MAGLGACALTTRPLEAFEFQVRIELGSREFDRGEVTLECHARSARVGQHESGVVVPAVSAKVTDVHTARGARLEPDHAPRSQRLALSFEARSDIGPHHHRVAGAGLIGERREPVFVRVHRERREQEREGEQKTEAAHGHSGHTGIKGRRASRWDMTGPPGISVSSWSTTESEGKADESSPDVRRKRGCVGRPCTSCPWR